MGPTVHNANVLITYGRQEQGELAAVSSSCIFQDSSRQSSKQFACFNSAVANT